MSDRQRLFRVVYRRPRRRAVAPPATAVGYVLVAAFGAFVMTGIAAALTSVRSFAAATGAFTFTGIAVAFSYGKTIVAGTGTFVLTGIDAALAKTKLLIAATGTFVMTGVANNWQRAARSATGTFVMTGIAAILQKTKLLLAETGVFSLLGVTQTILHRGTKVLYDKARNFDPRLWTSRRTPPKLGD